MSASYGLESKGTRKVKGMGTVHAEQPSRRIGTGCAHGDAEKNFHYINYL